MDERLPLDAVSLRDAALYVEHMSQATKGFVGVALRCGHAVQLLLGHVLGKKLRLPRALGPCAAPAYYVGNPRTIIPSGAQARWPSYAGILDYELEVALILGSNLEVTRMKQLVQKRSRTTGFSCSSTTSRRATPRLMR